MILLDTNLLTRITRSHDPRSGMRTAIQKLLRSGKQLIVVPQNLYEFWAVATRTPGRFPAGANGLGMSPARPDNGCVSSDGASRCFLTVWSCPGCGSPWWRQTA